MADFLLQEDGTSKILLEDGSALLLDAPGAIPTFVSASTFGTNTANVGVNIPNPAGMQEGDLMIACVFTIDSVVNMTNNQGHAWRLIGSIDVGTSIYATIFVRRYNGVGADATSFTFFANTFSSSVRIWAQIIAIRGAHGIRDLLATSSGTAVGAGQTLTLQGGATGADNELILGFLVTSVASGATFSGWADANLANVTERQDASNTGYGMGVVTGELATAGASGNITVVDSATSPVWGAFVLGFSPKTPPANDNFANREPISVGTGMQLLAGATHDASLEASEFVNTAFFGSIGNRTQWWEYVADVRRIVKVRVQVGLTAGSIMLTPRRGSSASTVVKYSPMANSPDNKRFGYEGEKGIQFDAVQGGLINQGSQRFQADPATALILQAGLTSAANNPDELYTIYFEQLEVPINDNFDTSLLLDVVAFSSGLVPYDFDPATYPHSFDKIAANLSVIPVGDLWYKFQSLVRQNIGIRFVKYASHDSNEAHRMYFWQGTSQFDLVGVPGWAGVHPQGSFEDLDEAIPAIITMEALQNYYVQTLWSYVSGFRALMSDGLLEWTLYGIPDNDDFEDAIDLGTSDSGTTVDPVNLDGGTLQDGEDGTWGPGSIWYTIGPLSGGWYEFTFANDMFDTSNATSGGFQSVALIAYRGTDLANLRMAQRAQWFGFQGMTPSLQMALRGGEQYYLALYRGSYSYDPGVMSWALTNPTAGANDDYANIQTISGASGTQAADIEGSTNELGEGAEFLATPPDFFSRQYWNVDDGSLWFEWTCPADGLYQFWTSGLTTDASMAVWDGTPFSAVSTKITSNSNGDSDLQTRVAFEADSGTTYTIEVTTFKEGSTGFVGPWALTLHWDTLTPLANSTFANAIEIGPGFTDSYDSDNYGFPIVPELDTPDIVTLLDDFEGFSFAGRVAWFTYTAPYSNNYQFTLETLGSEMVAQMFNGTTLAGLTMATDLSGDPAEAAASYESRDFGDFVHLTAGETVYIGVWNILWWDGADLAEMGTGQFTLSWTMQPTENDNLSSQSNVSARNVGNLNYFDDYSYPDNEHQQYVSSYETGGCRTVSNVAATGEVGEPALLGFAATRSVWFQLRVGTTGTYKFWVEGAGLDPVIDPLMAVYNFSSTFGGLGAALASDDDSGPGLYPQLTVSLTQFTRYIVKVDARDEGEFTLHYQRVTASPPANNDFANAITIVPGVAVSGDLTDATVDCFEEPPAGFQWGPFGSVWYTFTATEDTVVFFELDTSANASQIEYIYLDVYRQDGTGVEDLVNVTDADNYFNGSFEESIGLPVTVGSVYYVRVTQDLDAWANGADSAFSLNAVAQSTTPPANDDWDDATVFTPGSGTQVGTTDGSTVQVGEADPHQSAAGGQLDVRGGTTWHKYTAPAPGMVAIYTTRTGPSSSWYECAVWAGTAVPNVVLATVQEADPTFYANQGGYMRCWREVREGETYWIQVMRKPDQIWGEYTLHIDEYLEYNDWSYATDGFDSTTNAPDETGGVMTCSGSQAIADENDVLPQYGTIDLGADTPKWGRNVEIYFEVRIIGGQVLYRPRWYGDDVWNSTIIQSDDHVNMWTTHLGLFRCRDTDGNFVLACSLAGETTRKGENRIQIVAPGVEPLECPVSLGVGGNQHDTGWVGITVNATMLNNLLPNATAVPQWQVSVMVDGKPQPGHLLYAGKQIRYADIGMYRHPSEYGPGTTGFTDQAYVENDEAWTLQFQKMRITNILPQNPIDLQLQPGPGIFEFEGFAPGVAPVGQTNASVKFHQGDASYHSYLAYYFAVTDPGVYAEERLDWFVAEPMPDKTWSGFRTFQSGTYPDLAGGRKNGSYARQQGSRRVFGFAFRPDQFFTSRNDPIAGYAQTGFLLTAGTIGPAFSDDMATFILGTNGELRIKPYGRWDFCVAHLQPEHWYWIECHVDAEVAWDVKCHIYINGQDFGTFTNARTWAFVAGAGHRSINMTGGPTAQWIEKPNLIVGLTLPNSNQHYDLYFTNVVCGRGTPDDMIGPLETKELNAIEAAGFHAFPDEPDEFEDVYQHSGDVYLRMFGWMDDYVLGPVAGPWTVPDGTELHTALSIPRFWTPYFVLGPTAPQSHPTLRLGDGNYLSGTLDLTLFGNSVPVDVDSITGIQVKVYQETSGGSPSVQLMKAGAPVGSSKGSPDDTAGAAGEIAIYGADADLWGTTWTPQEANAMDFGVRVTGAPNIDRVTVQVFFEDEGVPDGISRGGVLAADGLYNVYGDTIIAIADAVAADGGVGFTWPSGGWEPSGIDGDSGPMDGSTRQVWGALRPLWLWQARGDKEVVFTHSGSGSATISNLRGYRNPLIYPRYAWSDDDGATWTWIFPGETASPSHIGTTVGASSGGKAIFLDNAGALDVWMHQGGSWSSGLNEDRPSSSPAYRFPYWALVYHGEDSTDDEILAINVWARFRAYYGPPTADTHSAASFHVALSGAEGSLRRVARFSQGPYFSSDTNPTDATPFLHRYTQPRSPDGTDWTVDKFNDVTLWVGMHNDNGGGTGFISSSPQGAVLYAMTYEVLVPAEADEPPGACVDLVPMNWRSGYRPDTPYRILKGS